MPKRTEKYFKGAPVYLTIVSEAMHTRGWRTIEEAGEEVHYSIFSQGIIYNEEGRPSLDIVNQASLDEMPGRALFNRIEIKNLILVSEYKELKKNSFKEPNDPIDVGTLVTINTSEGGRLIYAKIMNVEKSLFGDQYEIITTGNNLAHTVRRGDISLPTEIYNARSITIRQQLMEYSEGTEAQIIGSFLYIGGDDILVHEKFATNKKLI